MKTDIHKINVDKMKRLLQFAPDAYLILAPDLTILDASDTYLKATMVTREKIVGLNIFEAFPENPQDKTATGEKNLRASLNNVLKNKTADVMAVQKYDIRRPESQGGEYEVRYWSPFNVPVLGKNGEVELIIHRVEDVTDFLKLKQKDEQHEKITQELRTHSNQIEREIIQRAQEIQEANQKLQTAKEELERTETIQAKFAAIVEFTEDSIIAKDPNGIIQSWNKGAEHLYGYKEREVIGKSITLIFPPDYNEEIHHILDEIKRGHPVRFLETERRHKNGTIIPVSVTISPIKDKKGKIIGSCSIARDISEFKNIERMKNEFISIVSHELRTPLTSIQGSLSLLLAGTAGELTPKAQQLLNIGKQNSERLIRLIGDILDVEKIQSGKMEFRLEPLNIDSIVQEAVAANQAYADKFGVKIKLIQEGTAIVNIDRDRLLQVLANLISNAIKFSAYKKEVVVTLTKSANHIKVAVTNHGKGIDEEFKKRIFQKFSQGVSSQGGTGLGLSISKEIIEKLNGKIYFVSEPNKETSFIFELPISQKLPAVKKSFEKVSSVLICTNDRETEDYLKKILEDNHFKVIVSNNTQAAKQLLTKENIDALLLDLLIQDQDGISFIKDLRKNALASGIPIIVLTVKSEQGKKEINGSAIHVLDWIEKPIDFNRLVSAIQHIKQDISVKTPNILHVEDDVDLLEIVANLLQEKANIVGVTSLQQARDEFNKNKYDLVILDLMLPDGSGIELLPLISETHTPIIIFSAYELPKNYAHYVVKTLLKSKISPNEFVSNIKASIAKQNMKESSNT